MLYEPSSSLRPTCVGFGKHAPCRPAFSMLDNSGPNEGDETLCHFAAFISKDTPQRFNTTIGAKGEISRLRTLRTLEVWPHAG